MPPLAWWQCSSCASRGFGCSCAGDAGRDVNGVTRVGRCCCRSETGDEPDDADGDMVVCEVCVFVSGGGAVLRRVFTDGVLLPVLKAGTKWPAGSVYNVFG
jgi:hypothetical protein